MKLYRFWDWSTIVKIKHQLYQKRTMPYPLPNANVLYINQLQRRHVFLMLKYTKVQYMEDESVWGVIAGMLCGEASQEELKILQQLAQTNEGLRCYLKVMEAFWNKPLLQDTKEFEGLFEKITARLAVKDPCFFQYSDKKMN
jgi:diphthamide synthase subunit DPH2